MNGKLAPPRDGYQRIRNFGLELRLELPRLEADIIAILAAARHVEQLDEAGEMLPFALAGDHRGPAGLIIFVVRPGCRGCACRRLRRERQSRMGRTVW